MRHEDAQPLIEDSGGQERQIGHQVEIPAGAGGHVWAKVYDERARKRDIAAVGFFEGTGDLSFYVVTRRSAHLAGFKATVDGPQFHERIDEVETRQVEARLSALLEKERIANRLQY